MPYDLPLSKNLRQAGWKAKIHDFERLETPHVTIYCKRRKWRLSLRDGTFLDRGDKWNQIKEEVRETIVDTDNWETLCAEWDERHPDNPVTSDEADDDNH